ncbi:MAG TPA: ThiF family adenylyltransferase [Chthoniobacterales bacterium]|nr:ThiF family adenylyltransferase [Chthoniobacterales bacterium]
MWRLENDSAKWGVLLIGFPIPNRFGDSSSEVHWQPLFIDTIFAEAKSFKLRHENKHIGRWAALTKDGKFGPSEQLPWGSSTNISAERHYARGAFSNNLREQKIMVCGCGAIGSVAAEALARGGVRNLRLLDGDQFEFGNQSRHTLDGTMLRTSKAKALALRLSSGNLLSEIVGYHATLPLQPLTDGPSKAASKGLADSDLLIDCTASEAAFIWLNSFAYESQKRLASFFLSFGARFLTFCISGKHASCRKVGRRLFRDIQDGKTPISPTEYFRVPDKEEQIIPGAGCWHPTFPARIDHVWMMSSAAIDLLDRLIIAPIVSDGTAAVFKRSDIVPGSSRQNIVELVWLHRYR